MSYLPTHLKADEELLQHLQTCLSLKVLHELVLLLAVRNEQLPQNKRLLPIHDLARWMPYKKLSEQIEQRAVQVCK
jgi:hypothetical protein